MTTATADTSTDIGKLISLVERVDTNALNILLRDHRHVGLRADLRIDARDAVTSNADELSENVEHTLQNAALYPIVTVERPGHTRGELATAGIHLLHTDDRHE